LTANTYSRTPVQPGRWHQSPAEPFALQPSLRRRSVTGYYCTPGDDASRMIIIQAPSVVCLYVLANDDRHRSNERTNGRWGEQNNNRAVRCPSKRRRRCVRADRPLVAAAVCRVATAATAARTLYRLLPSPAHLGVLVPRFVKHREPDAVSAASIAGKYTYATLR